MISLPKPLRNELSRTVLVARKLAEAAAVKALHALGVDEADAPGHLDNEGRLLRRRLRAQARQLGDREDPLKKGCYETRHLAEKIAYDHWHRLLFARFLAGAFDHSFPTSAGFSTSGRLATLNWRNEAESSSLSLRLARSPSQASTPRLLPVAAGSATCATINSHGRLLSFC